MPVEGLNNIYGIPPVKKERDAGQEGRKKGTIREKKRSGKKKREKEPEGRVDIRV
jgi:hypothetical protein